jgi:hypothetical protein
MTENAITLPGFPPEFVDLFRRGSEGEVTIDFETADDAARLRYRLNDFRKQLRRKNHPLAIIAENVEICLNRIGEESKPRRLIARPRDMKTLEALRKAGVGVGEVSSLSEPGPESSGDVLSDIFGKKD